MLACRKDDTLEKPRYQMCIRDRVYKDKIYKTQAEFRADAHNLCDRNLLYTPWNKLFSGDYIRDNKLYFPQTFWDDFPFNLYVVRDVERVGVTSKQYYHFIRQRAESETAKYRSDMYEKREEENEWMREMCIRDSLLFREL